MNKISIIITNGKKAYVEDISDLIPNLDDVNYYREIKIKESDLYKYKDHIIYDWSQKFYESNNFPDWIYTSCYLDFEIILHK